MSNKYYESISEWIVDTDLDAPDILPTVELYAMASYSGYEYTFVDAVIISFASTGHLRIQQDGSIKRLPDTYWDPREPIQYYNFFTDNTYGS